MQKKANPKWERIHGTIPLGNNPTCTNTDKIQEPSRKQAEYCQKVRDLNIGEINVWNWADNWGGCHGGWFWLKQRKPWVWFLLFFINDIHCFQLERSIYWALGSVIIYLFIVCALCFPVSIGAAEILMSGQLTNWHIHIILNTIEITR